MAYDVFISYSQKDKIIADTICSLLEGSGLKCWMAPRDIVAGSDWSSCIVEAITTTKVFVLIFSEESNKSEHVKREVELAIDEAKIIIPVRIEDVPLSAHMRYLIKTQHWLDALTKPIEKHLGHLLWAIQSFIKNENINPSIKHDESSNEMSFFQSDSPINRNNIEWIFVKGDNFEMGDLFGDGEDDEKPLHTVTINDYYISKTPVTNIQFAKFLNEYGNDKVKTGEYSGQSMVDSHPWGINGQDTIWQPEIGYGFLPIICVSWYGAYEFAHHNGCRLPTEAEWEYAARSGGKNEKWAGFDGLGHLSEYLWYSTNSEDKPKSVGTKKANGLGIFDMCGNVWEWCNDWYNRDYYKSLSRHNPEGPAAGALRVIRGGSWTDNAKEARTVNRYYMQPTKKNFCIGFRVVVSASKADRKFDFAGGHKNRGNHPLSSA